MTNPRPWNIHVLHEYPLPLFLSLVGAASSKIAVPFAVLLTSLTSTLVNLWTCFTTAATCYVSEASEYQPRNCVKEFSLAFRSCTDLTSTAWFFLESLHKSLSRCVSVTLTPRLVPSPSYTKNLIFSHLFRYSLAAELSTIMFLWIGVEDFFSSQIARLRFLLSCYVLQSEAPKKNSSFNCCNLLGIEDMKLWILRHLFSGWHFALGRSRLTPSVN